MFLLYELTLTPIRFLTVYVAQGFICIWFAYLAYRILKRDRKRINFIFAGFYLSAVVGLFFNFIYAPLTNENIVRVLNYLTNFGIFYSPIFLVVFELILLKSEKFINTFKQLLILIGFGFFMFSMIFFVLTDDWGVKLNADTEWSPEWSLAFFLYLIIGESLFAIVPLLYLSIKIYNKFEDEQLKRKWKYFIFGFCALSIFMYGIFLSNFLASYDLNIRLVMGVIGLLCAFSGGYLMYSGVGRQLEK
ncbi:MAG: hypothetical protein ACFFHD_04185 [Promethearchaeota archaeon]